MSFGLVVLLRPAKGDDSSYVAGCDGDRVVLLPPTALACYLRWMSKQSEWRAVVGSPDYEVSDQGEVRRLTTRGGQLLPEPRLLKIGRHSRGYAVVALSGPNITRNNRKRLVHVIVLEAFVGPCPDGMEARHFPDRSRTNNRLSNLSWGTALENSRDRADHGTDHGWNMPPRYRGPNAQKTDSLVLEVYHAEGSQRDIAKRLGVTQQDVSAIKLGKIFANVIRASGTPPRS